MILYFLWLANKEARGISHLNDSHKWGYDSGRRRRRETTLLWLFLVLIIFWNAWELVTKIVQVHVIDGTMPSLVNVGGVRFSCSRKRRGRWTRWPWRFFLKKIIFNHFLLESIACSHLDVFQHLPRRLPVELRKRRPPLVPLALLRSLDLVVRNDQEGVVVDLGRISKNLHCSSIFYFVM